MTTAPPMQRSRTQLASAYAPNSLFTFEGGAGACMAISFSGNRAADDDLRTVTRRLIGEQIQEYFDAWLSRATRGNGLLHPVPNSLAVDTHVLRDGVVDVALGDLAFQVPDRVGYIPFPLAFVCGRCGLHRECDRVESLVSDAERFRQSCPSGARPMRRRLAANRRGDGSLVGRGRADISPIQVLVDTGEIHTIRRCGSCDFERFYLRRPPGPFAGWHFECVACRTPRQTSATRPLDTRDTRSAHDPGRAPGPGNVRRDQHGADFLSCFGGTLYARRPDTGLQRGQVRPAARQRTRGRIGDVPRGQFGYPATAFSDQQKESLLRDAGRGNEWTNYAQLRLVAQMLQETPRTPRPMINAQLATIARMDDEWNATVFAQHRQAEPGIVNACAMRHEFVRRFDPIRMAVEHRTLSEEKLHGGQLADGKQISVDVTILDEFLFPDEVTEEAKDSRFVPASRRRLGYPRYRRDGLVRDVQVCEYTFGYTRTSATPDGSTRQSRTGRNAGPPAAASTG